MYLIRPILTLATLSLAGCATPEKSKPNITGCTYVVSGFEDKFPPLVIPPKTPDTKYLLRIVRVTLPPGEKLKPATGACDYDYYNQLFAEFPTAKFEVLPILHLIPGKESVEENGMIIVSRNGTKKEIFDGTNPDAARRMGCIIRASCSEAKEGEVGISLKYAIGELQDMISYPNGSGSELNEAIINTRNLDTNLTVRPGCVVKIGSMINTDSKTHERITEVILLELDRPYPNQTVKILVHTKGDAPFKTTGPKGFTMAKVMLKPTNSP